MQRRSVILGAPLSLMAASTRAATKSVVLELFTSQGCSSCPPADALLGRLSRRPDVIGLAWHVDYWDGLGWRDRFASREATQRQRDYAASIGGGVFTPALVVNGARVVVGSEARAVDAAMTTAGTLPVEVALNRIGDTLSVEIGAAGRHVRAQRIVYDPEQATNVGAGENDGVQLREYRVVRQVETLAEWDGTARRLAARLPGSGQGQVILVQSSTLQVLGAADLPQA